MKRRGGENETRTYRSTGVDDIVVPRAEPQPEWRQIRQGVSSTLVVTGSLRTLDRLRRRARLRDAEVASRRAAILELVAFVELAEIDAVVLDRASQPMPTDAPRVVQDDLWLTRSTRGHRREVDERSSRGARPESVHL